MKKIITYIALAVILISTLSGCFGTSGVNNVESLQGWTFQYNKDTNDYSVFFALLNKNKKSIPASVDVDIRIVNENGKEVYKATKSVSPDDFGTYTSMATGDQYLAEIRIPEKDIISGNSSNGTVYLTVYKDDVLRFDEVHCAALYCLPIADIKLKSGPFPVEINVRGLYGNIESKIQIDKLSYVYEKEYLPLLKITIFGIKTYGKSNSAYSAYDKISYKVLDNEGYMVHSGELYLDSLSQGDKFKDDSIMIYDIEPGKRYTIIFSESDW